MKHEIAAEWNGNETKVIARDTRRIQREWTTTGDDDVGGDGDGVDDDDDDDDDIEADATHLIIYIRESACKRIASAYNALSRMKPAVICSRELFIVRARTSRTARQYGVSQYR